MRIFLGLLMIFLCVGCNGTQFINPVGNPKKPAVPDQICGVWSSTDAPGAFLHIERKIDNTVDFVTVEHLTPPSIKPGGLAVRDLGSGFLAEIGQNRFFNVRDPISLNYSISMIKLTDTKLSVAPISYDEVNAALKSSRLKGKLLSGNQLIVENSLITVENSRRDLIKFLERADLSTLFPDKDAFHYEKLK